MITTRNLMRIAMFALAGLLLSSVSARPALADVANDAGSAKALAVGASAPGFTAHRENGSTYQFDPHHLSRPQVLIFYRGGWCPYCNTQLADLHEVEPKLRKSGFD